MRLPQQCLLIPRRLGLVALSVFVLAALPVRPAVCAQDQAVSAQDQAVSAQDQAAGESEAPGGDSSVTLSEVSTLETPSSSESQGASNTTSEPEATTENNVTLERDETLDGVTGAPKEDASDTEREPDTDSDTDSDTDTDSASSAAISTESPETSTPEDKAILTEPSAETVVPWLDFRAYLLIGVVLAILATASIVGTYLSRRPTDGVNPALIRKYRHRIQAWWFMCAIVAFGVLLRPAGTIVLCFFVSFWALREFITMAPTRRGDHRGLFWALVVFTPLQYVLIGLERLDMRWYSGSPIDFYGLYSIVIPVYASLYVPARIAMSGDHKKFLERSAQITFGLLICVYCLSYAAALVNLDLRTSTGAAWGGSPAGLLFFFILISQISEILQWTWGYLVGDRLIAPEISATKNWEGLIGGTLSTGLVGAALAWVTPFTILEAACLSMVIAVMGFFGSMSLSAIKRDRGVNDYGTLVQGHAGVLDRIDTICFAAPVFYHLTRLFFAS